MQTRLILRMSMTRNRKVLTPKNRAITKGSKRIGLHPATVWNLIRHHGFSILEKTGDLERAVGALSDYSLPPKLQRTLGAGLKAELIFFLKKQKTLQLEVLLDACARADFMGIRRGRPVNIDVTTNLDYKDIDRYSAI